MSQYITIKNNLCVGICSDRMTPDMAEISDSDADYIYRAFGDEKTVHINSNGSPVVLTPTEVIEHIVDNQITIQPNHAYYNGKILTIQDIEEALTVDDIISYPDVLIDEYLYGVFKKWVIQDIKAKYLINRQHSKDGFMSQTLQAQIDSTETDILNVQSLVFLMEQTGMPTVDYKLKDNSFQTVTLAQLKNVLAELINNQFSSWSKKQTLTTKAETAINITKLREALWV